MAVTAALLFLVLRLIDPRALGNILRSMDLRLLGLVILLTFADRGVMIGKWYPLLRVQVPDIPLHRAARAYLAAHSVSLFVSSLGSDVVRAFALGRDRQAVMQVGSSVVAERALGMLGSAVLVGVALVVALGSPVAVTMILPWAVLAIGASLAVVVLPLLNWSKVPLAQRGIARLPAPVANFIRRFATAYATYRRHPGTVAVVGVLSTLEQLFPIGILWLICLALHIPLTLRAAIIAVPLATFAERLPATLNGLGAYEVALVYLLGLFGVSTSEAVALAIVSRFVDLLIMVPGALMWGELLHGLRSAAPATDP